MENETEDRYERIELIVKSRPGEHWFDIISDFITGDCQGGGGECIDASGERIPYDVDANCDDHEHTEEFPCTCGMESMGGTMGTLAQCFEAGEMVGYKLKRIDVAKGIVEIEMGQTRSDNAIKVLKWAEDEIRFEETWEEEHK